MNNRINYEDEALKLKSLLAVIAGVDPDNTDTLYDVHIVAKMAYELSETLYCAIADHRLKEV